MVADARARAAMGGGPGTMGSASPGASASASASIQGPTAGSSADHDDRPTSVISLSVADGDAHRGLPLHVHGDVRADGESCAHVPVEVWLRDPKTQRMTLLGTLATGDDGSFGGGLVVPGATLLGEYDVVARTSGDARCGGGG
jgi:hypothetical protein